MKILRHLLSLPFAILGALLFGFAELISGNEYTFGSEEKI